VCLGAEVGLRERKKSRTRQQIGDVAWRLFLERGFDRVSVAEIAREADVAEATVFNYFPTKEDLVFGRLATFEDDTLAAVRARPAGESVVAAFGRLLAEPGGLLGGGDPDASAAIAAATRLILGSRALLDREREFFDRFSANLAALIGEDRGPAPDEIEAQVIAHALIGVQRALVSDVRRQVLAGVDSRVIARSIGGRGRRAIDLLQHGLAGLGGAGDSGQHGSSFVEPNLEGLRVARSVRGAVARADRPAGRPRRRGPAPTGEA
jgi:AcrR family transcriptional regulator